MIGLEPGDERPIVATCQLLLNASGAIGQPLEVDGFFGELTEEAVKVFQHRNGLAPSGEVGRKTWPILARASRFVVHDSVDVFDPFVYRSTDTLKLHRAQPILVGGMCNGLAAVHHQLAANDTGEGKLVLLRFHGHGKPGRQMMGMGTPHHIFFDAIRHEAVPPAGQRRPADPKIHPQAQIDAARLEAHYSAVSLANLREPQVRQTLAPMARFFHPSGSVEFHGCNVGDGEEGRAFLRAIADMWAVPALGAHETQYPEHAVRFGGPIEIQCPGGGDVAGWARKLQSL